MNFYFNRTLYPTSPGVYLFRDKYSQIIYVGKAKNLRERLSSYFNSSFKSVKTQVLVKNIVDIEYFSLENELEALLLENKLIKKHSPKYNILLKDSKTYAYIVISDEKIPKIYSTRKVSTKGTYFGPFTDGKLRRDLISLTVKLFNIITPKTYSSKSTIYYDIGIAPAPNLEGIDEEAYKIQVKKAIDFLKGKNISILKQTLYREMIAASENNQYELALEKKNQIESIGLLFEKQSVDRIKQFDEDIIVFSKDETHISILVLNAKKGVLTSKRKYYLEYDSEVLSSFIRMYYSSYTPPKEILFLSEIWDSEEEKSLLEEYLTSMRGTKVSIYVPVKGDKKRLIEIALKNLQENSISTLLEKIKINLHLNQIPKVIECFDISNLGPNYVVSGMTKWINLSPQTSEFRRFEIKSFKGKNDDFESMREVVFRRYSKLIDAKKSLPNLVLIDGGKGQISAAMDSLKKLNLEKSMDVRGLAKREEEFFSPENSEPIICDKNEPFMLALRSIRDRTHNFAISYNKKKRDMFMKNEYKNS